MNLTNQKPHIKGQSMNHQKPNDDKFLAWIRKQPSALSDGKSIAAHVRRASNSGTGVKPLFSAIPLTWQEHNDQSWYGEAGCLNRHLPRKEGLWSNIEAKEWFEDKRDYYVEKYHKECKLNDD